MQVKASFGIRQIGCICMVTPGWNFLRGTLRHDLFERYKIICIVAPECSGIILKQDIFGNNSCSLVIKNPPSPVVMTLNCCRLKQPMRPNVPKGFPLKEPPLDCATSSIKLIPGCGIVLLVFPCHRCSPHVNSNNCFCTFVHEVNSIIN